MVLVEAAFFDLDKTVISRSSSFALSRPMYRAGLVSRTAMLRGAYAQIVFMLLGADERRMDKAKRALLELTRGWEQSQVEDVVRDVVIDLIEPFVYQEALDLMAEHRRAGRQVFVVSSAPEEVVRPLGEHFGANGVVATRAAVVDGRYTGHLEFYCFGQAKADAIRQLAKRAGIDLSSSFAYSDSPTDLPMLEAVGNPVAVNAHRDLRREAEDRGWEVRDFLRPVRVRARSERRSGPLGAAIAAAAFAAVIAWVYLRPRRARS